MNKGEISVLMAVYNCAGTVRDSIDSILAQTYTNWKMIICDDCSTDETLDVLREYKKRFPEKFIIITNKKNSKLAYSLNHCLKYAEGEYCARMDGDDRCLPERFEKQIEFLRNHPEYDLVGTAMQRFDESGFGMINYSVDNPDYYTLRRAVPYHHATILTYNKQRRRKSN